eukprot:CFRG8487T1
MSSFGLLRSLFLGLFAAYITYQAMQFFTEINKFSDKFEVTLAIIKPNAITHADAITKRINSEGFSIVKQKTATLSPAMVTQFYSEHAMKPFYNDLIEFMSSGPSIIMEIQKQNAVREWRDIIGPTKPSEAKRVSINSLRALYGDDTTRNGFHGSESVEAAMTEISLLFGAKGRRLKEADRKYYDLEELQALEKTKDKKTET